MDDLTKISRLEFALRTERDNLRKMGGPANIRAANSLNDIVQNADCETKLRLANLIIEHDTREEAIRDLRAVK